MGLSASLWTSVSGLLAHGQKMNVVGNNLANVSTIGFKSQRMDFEDFVYTNQFAASGTEQVGLGVGVNAIIGDFSQGAFELTNSATDLAISGTGFFKVISQSTGSDYYTRAGNFNFNAEGFLTTPSGEVLQGWKVRNDNNPLPAAGINPVIQEDSGIKTDGEATDIRLNSWTVLPKATAKVEFSVNLTAEENNDRSVSVENPLFAMSDTWNGKEAIENNDVPISSEAYEYSAPIKVYDEGGKAHTLTAYFDRVPTTSVDSNGNEYDVIDNLPEGYEVYEYMLTMNPEEDARTFGGTYNPTTGVLEGATTFQETEAAGILMKGTMIFNAAGELVTQTAYTYMGNTDFAPGQTITPNEIISSEELDEILAQPAGDRATYIAGMTLDPDDAAIDAEAKAQLTAALELANKNAESIAKTTADKAADSAANTVGINAAIADEAGITSRANDRVFAIADGPAEAAANAAHPGQSKGDAEWDAAYNAVYDPMESQLFQPFRNDEYKIVYDAAYSTIYPAPYSGDYYKAQYDATHIPLRESLQTDALRDVAYDINSSQIGHPDSDLSWQPTEMSAEGYPLFTANFSGHPMGNAVGQEKSQFDTTDSKDANDIWMEFDLGLQSESPVSPWQYKGSALQRVTYPDPDPSVTGIPLTASIKDTQAILSPTGDVVAAANYENLGILVPNEASVGSSTSLGTASSTNFSSQDGYPSGDLTNVHIDADGVVFGVYSNGVNLPLYQIAMYDFVNPQGLYREGGNLFSETLESGSIQEAKAGIAGMGTINSYNIEQSNVDMAREFVQMIATQRGFQSNSKGITTVDTMLEQVINMKR